MDQQHPYSCRGLRMKVQGLMLAFLASSLCVAALHPAGSTSSMEVRRCLSVAAVSALASVEVPTVDAPGQASALAGAHDYTCVARGQVFAARNWLSDDLLVALRADARALLGRGKFDDANEPIGRRLKRELYRNDWAAEPDDESGEAERSDARAAAERLIDGLRVNLECAVGRPLFLDARGAQAKYSLAKLGEPVYWHVDLLHEAFPTVPQFRSGVGHRETTRRGLAWLLYLGDDDWGEVGASGHGGNLRAYPRRDVTSICGSHEGNLQVHSFVEPNLKPQVPTSDPVRTIGSRRPRHSQRISSTAALTVIVSVPVIHPCTIPATQVGWLERGRGSEPVFLDSWILPRELRGGRTLVDLRREWSKVHRDDDELLASLLGVQPAYVLYCVGEDGEREKLCSPHECPGRDIASGEWREHVPSLREMLPPHLQPCFSSTLRRDHPAQQPVEVSPRGGTLVVFDPVAVPHEVTPVLSGDRLALFGFFAEARHVPAAWIDDTASEHAWYLDGRAHTDDA